MASNKKSYDGAHDYKQELKSGYRHSEWFEANTCHNIIGCVIQCQNGVRETRNGRLDSAHIHNTKELISHV